jgi:hypothetical protein
LRTLCICGTREQRVAANHDKAVVQNDALQDRAQVKELEE